MKLQIPEAIKRQRAKPARPAKATQVQKLAAATFLAKVSTFKPILARDGTVDKGLTTTKAILTFGRR